MCGICGQVNRSGAPAELGVVQAMMSAIRHRGPDSAGHLVRGAVALGHLRLSIIDLSPAGHQPMSNADGRFWIVFNGEIYNYRELKHELEQAGEAFRSASDTEVLLRLYQRDGERCVQKLHGMFAFAIWDDAEQRLFLARDRVGIKPLYYYADERVLTFGSEIKAILQSPAVPRSVHSDAVITYFTFGHSFGPQTIYDGIKKLLPAHYLTYDQSGLRVEKYWELPDSVPQLGLREEDCAEQVRHLLRQAVTSHMVSDVPLGAFLSGGIDSSAIVAFMAEASTQPVKTFSIGFDIGGYFNELDDARLIAQRFGTEHHERIVSELDVEQLIQKMVYHYDEPFADAANLPTYIVSELAREHVKVVLSGEGGDEGFGGYRRYITHALSPRFQAIPAILRERVVRPIAALLPTIRGNGSLEFSRRVRKVVETMSIAADDMRYGTWLAFFSEDQKSHLLAQSLGPELARFDGYDTYRDYYNRFPRWEPINRALYTDLKGWLPDTYLEKIDKATMAVSLEGRVPFLDHRLLEYVFTLPARMKVRGCTTKYILKKSLEGILPRSTLYKPKHGFAVPLDEWFRGRLKEFARDALLGPGASGYLDRMAVESILDQHAAHQANHGIHIWTMLNFELWHQIFMRNRIPAASGVSA
jgi:asparagine synthase (glutamine-hydrolysing)